MNVQDILHRMYAAAKSTKDDVRSVAIMRAADRLAHVGAFAETPLTNDEIKLIGEFIG